MPQAQCLQCTTTFHVSPAHHAKGRGKFCSWFCRLAYEGRYGRTGKRTVAERLWAYVEKTPGCWLWTGSINARGYGAFNPGRGRAIAHRYVYELTYGLILSKDILVCHACDVRHCVRPDHLFLGTKKDNMADSIAKGRHIKGSMVGIAKLHETDILPIRALKGKMATRDVAQQYNVSVTTILNIWRRRTWKHIQ